VPRDGFGLVDIDDSAPQAMTDVRPAAVDLPFVCVEAHREVADLRHPERFVEALLQPCGLVAKSDVRCLVIGLEREVRAR